MALPATALQTGMNMLQVGALRMPMLFASLNSALLTGEIAYRVVRATLNGVGFTGESTIVKYVRDNTPQIAVDVMRPYHALTAKQLVVSAIVTAIIGTLGTQFVSWAFGQAPAIYNNVLTWLGPVRLSNDVHPAITMARNYFNI